MKANELMIGDWVLTLDSTHKEKVFAQVDAIEEGKDSILVVTGCSNWFVDIDWIEPIHLTKEILEKNGFFIDRDAWFKPRIKWRNRDNMVILHNEDEYLNTFNKWHVHVDTEDMRTIGSIELTYVHQFQQFLRLCVLNDLADNFKI